MAIVLLLSAETVTAAEAEPCPQPAMQSPIDAAAPQPKAGEVIEFSAVPAFDHSVAWVVRIRRGGADDASLAITRLHRRPDCNRYDVDRRWTSPLPADAYRRLAERLTRAGMPPADAFSYSRTIAELIERVPGLDGADLRLRLRNEEWRIERRLRYSERSEEISSLFHELVARYVPADDVPTADWRSRRAPPSPADSDRPVDRLEP